MSSGFNSVQCTSQEILFKPNVSTVGCCLLQWYSVISDQWSVMFTTIIVQTQSLSRELQNVNYSDTIAINTVYMHVHYAYISITAPYYTYVCTLYAHGWHGCENVHGILTLLTGVLLHSKATIWTHSIIHMHPILSFIYNIYVRIQLAKHRSL